MHGVIAAVLAALVFGDDRDAIGVVAIGAQPAGFADGHAEVVAQFGAGQAFGAVLVIERFPLAGEIDLGSGGGGEAERGLGVGRA